MKLPPRNCRASARFLLLVSLAVAPARQASAASKRALEAPDSMVKELRYEELERALPSLPSGCVHDYFAGILANREGRLEESIRLLTSALPELRTTFPARAAQALESLADDYVKSYRYADAGGACGELLQHFGSELDKTELHNFKEDCAAFTLLKNAPPQTIEIHGPVEVATHRSKLGSIDANLNVNGVTGAWMLDSGANFSVVTSSFARRLHLTISKKHATVKGGITGLSSGLRVAILPELKFSRASIHNVVLLVMSDESLNLSLGRGSTYQIHAILGYPVFQALGAVTFSDSGELRAGPEAIDAGAETGLFMNKLTPLIQCAVDGRNLLFSFDTGANDTQLSDRYYREFASSFKGIRMRRFSTAGAGGAREMEVYVLPQLTFTLGREPVTLHDVSVLPSKVGTDFDESFGNLGRDFTAGFDSFTLDFEHMRFQLGARKAAATEAAAQ